jgi:hypothetical protein
MHMHCSAQKVDAEPAQDRPQSFHSCAGDRLSALGAEL